MAEWIYFLHPPRENFATTMTEAEKEVWGRHFVRLENLVKDGIVVIAGPTLGPTNTGIVIFEASDQPAAEAIMNADPAITEGIARGELRPFRVSLVRPTKSAT